MQSDTPTTNPARTILFHASRDALAPMTDVILAKLGYSIVVPESFETLRAENPELTADMLLVDERRLGVRPWRDSARGRWKALRPMIEPKPPPAAISFTSASTPGCPSPRRPRRSRCACR
jgi:hypothetical protein